MNPTHRPMQSKKRKRAKQVLVSTLATGALIAWGSSQVSGMSAPQPNAGCFDSRWALMAAVTVECLPILLTAPGSSVDGYVRCAFALIKVAGCNPSY